MTPLQASTRGQLITTRRHADTGRGGGPRHGRWSEDSDELAAAQCVTRNSEAVFRSANLGGADFV
jgi:hypothetical protein